MITCRHKCSWWSGLGDEKGKSQMTSSLKRITRSVKWLTQSIAIAIVATSAWGITLTGATAAADTTRHTLQSIRPDLKEVIYAITYRIQGVTFEVSPTLLFNEDIGEIADPTGLSYKFLNLQDIALMKFEERRHDSFAATVVLKFEDPMGRRAFLSVAAQYTAKNGVIYVEEVVVEPFYSPLGDAVVLRARSKDLPNFSLLQDMSLEEAYLQMLQNGINLDDAFLSRSEPERLTLLVLDQVRQREGTSLDVLHRGGVRPDVKALSRHNQGGWAYILLEGDFPPNEATEFELFRLSGDSDGPEPVSLGHLSLGAGN
jgi:hypothetical protein